MRLASVSRALRRLVPLAVLLTLAANRPGAAPGAAWDAPGPDWADGPVRSLLAEDQVAAYRGLATVQARAEFVEAFWAARDPTPGTPENELRDLFVREVEDANARFSEGATPGWKTLRGRTLLKAGYPDDWRPGGAGEEIWTYNVKVRDPRVRDPKADARWIFTLGFRRQEDGSYRALKYEGHGGLKDLLRTLEAMQPAEYVAYLATRGAAPPVSKGRDNPMAAALNAVDPGFDDYTRMQDSFKKDNPEQEFGLRAAAFFFGYSGEETLVLAVVALDAADARKDSAGKLLFLPLAEIDRLHQSKPFKVGSLGQNRFTAITDDASGTVLYGASWHVPPGDYVFRSAALDGAGGRIASHQEAIRVPDLGKYRVSLSSLVLIRLIGEASNDPGAPDQYRIGDKRLVPWVGTVRPAPEGLRLYFEVHGVKASGKRGPLPVDVTIAAQRKSDSGWSDVMPEPISIHDPPDGSVIATLGPEIVSKWTAGEYRVSVSVRERSSDTHASAAREFEFAP